MTATKAARQGKSESGTGDKLIQAAVREFKAHGYSGTDTNRIAARASAALRAQCTLPPEAVTLRS